MGEIDLYRYNAEDEKDRYVFYYTYQEPLSDIVEKLEGLLEYRVYVYDVFPGMNTKEETLEDPISVITTIGTEMIIPPKTKVTIFDMATILFGEAEEES
ncbi:MAG TPA: hypothetical protein DEQ32_13205 [Gammaproteobacteria bacterium]|nr:hypothetical protein [Gammaproteobacteria bacterium]|tara:strand:- start:329 stop:625 length:297 start_codon:yes stop_codon:yes gene_type:complete